MRTILKPTANKRVAHSSGYPRGHPKRQVTRKTMHSSRQSIFARATVFHEIPYRQLRGAACLGAVSSSATHRPALIVDSLPRQRGWQRRPRRITEKAVGIAHMQLTAGCRDRSARYSETDAVVAVKSISPAKPET